MSADDDTQYINMKANLRISLVGVGIFLSLLLLTLIVASYLHYKSLRRFGISTKRAENILSQLKIISSNKYKENYGMAKEHAKKIRVLCWIMTSPATLNKKALHVKNTWGRRCNVLLFMSSKKNESFPVVALNGSEGRDHLLTKTILAFNYVYEHYFDDADWFMKTDDDTYVILENLRYFLSNENTSEPIVFGHHFKPKPPMKTQEFVSGGAGYVLSKEALRRFGNKGKEYSVCRRKGGFEDVRFVECLRRLGVRIGDTTDSLGRSRFHCFRPEYHLEGGYPDWYIQYDAHGAKHGQENISKYAITFHYVRPKMMYQLEFYFYHIKLFGINTNFQGFNQETKSKPTISS